MKRREILKQLGLGLPMAMGTGMIAPWLASCRRDDPGPEVPYDGTVAIIGAGAAGLYAADILTAKGIKVIILEASGQIGGRIRSLRNITAPTESLLFPVIPEDPTAPLSIADFPVELGADHFSGTDSVWGKIINNLRLQTFDLSETEDHFAIDNVVKGKADWQGDSDFVASQNFVSNLRNYSGAIQSVREAVSGLSERIQPVLNSQIGNYYGSNNERVGITGLSENLKLIQHDQKPFLLKSNHAQDILLSRFAELIPQVQLNMPVKSIDYLSDPIVITLEDGSQVEANKVIVTVPLSTLKKGGITFSPALPSTKVESMSKFGMDDSVRIILDFKKNLWGENSGFIWGGAVAPQYLNAGRGRSEFYRTLSITINGPKATALSAKGADMIPDVLGELDAIYGESATEFVRRSLVTEQIMYVIQDWSKEKYIQGGYSYPLPSARFENRTALSSPVEGKVFFAGEATDLNGEPGTINGALSSAERVAEEVVKAILGIA